MVHQVESKEDFDTQLEEAGRKLVVVDFMATWCGPCKLISPFITQLAEEYKDMVVFLKVDVDECEELAAEYDVSCMPTFLFFKNKEKVDEFSGPNQNRIKELVEQHKAI